MRGLPASGGQCRCAGHRRARRAGQGCPQAGRAPVRDAQSLCREVVRPWVTYLVVLTHGTRGGGAGKNNRQKTRPRSPLPEGQGRLLKGTNPPVCLSAVVKIEAHHAARGVGGVR
jgi:hypothetical protein